MLNRHPSLAAFLNRWQWIIVASLCVVAFTIRVVPGFDGVFQPGFVNFQETDAWYHVRVAENLVRHFPWRIMVDPYVFYGKVLDTPTAPFYDWFLGLIAWVAGGGAPPESLVHAIAAWYPVALAICTVVAVFVLARFIFGLGPALLATAIIATLPGHFLRVSSIGFTDHHIMESLLVTLYFFLLLRAIELPRAAVATSIAAGLTLAAYLLTFHGSALVIGVVIMWALADRIQWVLRGETSQPSLLSLYVSFLVALCICLLFYRQLWINYAIAALVLGSLAVGGVELLRKLCRRSARPRRAFISVLGAAGLALLAAVVALAPSLRHPAKIAVTHLMPSLFGKTGGVYELQSLIYDDGRFTLLPALRQFYGAYIFALIGLCLLAASIVKRWTASRALIFFWGFTTFVLAMGTLRMTYYYAIAVALLSGYAAEGLFDSGRKTAWVAAAALLLLVFVPNLYAAANVASSTGISPDWKEALDWMRTSTKEPFGDPAFFYARYDRQQFGKDYRYPPSAYTVMAWWDYGYWIVDVARRIPVTNPTQGNAAAAADIFLAQSEREALPLLQAWRTRYVVVDELLPLFSSSGTGAATVMVGDYPQFFQYSKRNQADYLLLAYEANADGTPTPKVFYRPAYYRSLVIRLFLFGGKAVDGQNGATILSLRRKEFARGKYYQEVVGTRRYESAREALAAEAACQDQGCVLVSDNPLISCAELEPLQQFRPVFSSTTSVLGFGNTGRKSVQVYEFTGAAEP